MRIAFLLALLGPVVLPAPQVLPIGSIPIGAAAPPAFVKGTVGNCNFCASTSFTATFGSNVMAGNALLGVAFWDNNTTTFNSATDSCGNTYTLGTVSATSNNGWVAQPFWKGNAAGGSPCVVTMTFSTTIVRTFGHVYEASGLNASPFQASAANDNMFQALGNTLNSGTVVTTSPNEFIMFVITDGGANGGVMTPGTGTTRTTDNTGSRSSTGATVLQVAAGSVTPTWTDSTASNSLAMTVAYKQ